MFIWYIFKPKGFEKTLVEIDAKEREDERIKLSIKEPSIWINYYID